MLATPTIYENVVRFLDDRTLREFSLQDPPHQPLLLQELFLFLSALGQVDKEQQAHEAGDADSGEEVERGGFVVGGGGVNDNAGKDGADERGGFTNDAEEGEEEEFFAARGDF